MSVKVVSPAGGAVVSAQPTCVALTSGDGGEDAVRGGGLPVFTPSPTGGGAVGVEPAGVAAAGVELVSPPHVIFTHADDTLGPSGAQEWQAFLRDSEGNTVGLVEWRV